VSALVLRGSAAGWIHGVGVCDAYGRAFQFPAVGERFEAPGPELVAIGTNRAGANEPDDQLEHGIHGYWWGCTGGEQVAAEFGRWALGDFLILEAAEPDVVHDKWRTTVGKCRVKRGVVAFVGDLPGAVDYMRERWPQENGPAPAWEDDPGLFPPPPPPPKPTEWVYDGNNGRLVRIETIRAKYG
jgi:hypothetical protein